MNCLRVKALINNLVQLLKKFNVLESTDLIVMSETRGNRFCFAFDLEKSTNRFNWSVLSALVVTLCAIQPHFAQAGLFEDEDARKAILDMRQQIDEQKITQQRTDSAIEKIKHSMLDEASTLEGLRAEIATLRGEKDSLTKDISDTQRKLKDLMQTIEARFSALEPVKITVDGVEVLVEQRERREFESALEKFKSGDFVSSTVAFNDFIHHYPLSGYRITSLFWLGNAQYATREYKDAMANFKMLISLDPKHLRAPEALLSISNCQLDLKDTKAAKKTLDELTKTYPDSEAAQAAKERLAKLK